MTISDLQSGVSYLEVECGTHTSSDIEFVKTHIDVLLACHDTLQKVRESGHSYHFIDVTYKQNFRSFPLVYTVAFKM